MAFKPVDAAIVMVVGPCIDDTDSKTLEEAIAYNAAGMDVSLIVEKTDGTTTVTAITLTTGGTSDWTHIDGGYYEVEVTAVQNVEEGIAHLRGVCTGVLPFESPRYDVVKANIYDSLVKGTDVLQTDITQIGGVTQSLTDFKSFVDNCYNPTYHRVDSNLQGIANSSNSATDFKDFVDLGYDPVTNKIEGVKLADAVTTNSDMRGTDSAALATALSTHDGKLDTVDSLVDTLIARLTAARAGYLDNLSAGAVALAATALTDVTWTDAKAAFLNHSIATVDTVADGIQSDLDNATDGLGALKALIDTIDGIVDAILLDTGTDGVVVASGSKTGYTLTATGADLILKDSLFMLAIANAVWDAILTGATHNIATSAGRRVREIGAFAIHSGTAQAGNAIHLTLAATASATDGIYNRNLLVIVGGTGAGQTRTIVDYDGTTKIALADREWRVSPDATSEYQITPDDTPLTVDHGLVQGATDTTITIRDYASSVDNTYLCNIIIILAGTGRGQARLVSSYNGTTKVITICGENWTTVPDIDSVYALIPYGASCVGCLTDDALSQVVAANIAGITDGSYDQQEMMRIMFAALSGKSSGGGTDTLAFRNAADSKDRISETVDVNGNRTAVTRDGT